MEFKNACISFHCNQSEINALVDLDYGIMNIIDFAYTGIYLANNKGCFYFRFIAPIYELCSNPLLKVNGYFVCF